MKVLHIGNTGGVASSLAYEMDKECFTQSQVLQPRRNDPYGLTFYGRTIAGRVPYYLRCGEYGLKSDLLHIHAQHEHIPEFKALRKPIVLHYHGTDIRGRWAEKKTQWENVENILVSTRDLLEGAPGRAVHLPNPVSPSFTPGAKPVCECAVHFSKGADDLAVEIAEEHELPLIIVKKAIPHREMPALLRNYTHLVEAKRVNGREVMGGVEDTGSLTSLEALACGLKVICRDGMREGLPPEHRPDVAVGRLWRIYREALA